MNINFYNCPVISPLPRSPQRAIVSGGDWNGAAIFWLPGEMEVSLLDSLEYEGDYYTIGAIIDRLTHKVVYCDNNAMGRPN